MKGPAIELDGHKNQHHGETPQNSHQLQVGKVSQRAKAHGFRPEQGAPRHLQPVGDREDEAHGPEPGRQLGQIGPVREHQLVEVPLELDLKPKQDLSLVIVPTNCDGVDYFSREAAMGPELVVEYELK